MGKYTISEEERKARSERMKEQNRARRGQPVKSKGKSANEEVAQWAKDHPQQILKALKRCLESDSPQTVIKAVLVILDVELKVDKAKDSKSLGDMTEEELRELLVEKLGGIPGFDLEAFVKASKEERPTDAPS